jgi:hypothetical protein
VEELKQAETEDGEDLRVDLRQRSIGIVFEEMIEGSLPTECAGDDASCQGTVAVVGEGRTADCESRWKICAVGGDGDQGMKCCRPRRGRHLKSFGV